MALSPSNPDTFLREVDDAVREDRMRNFVTGNARLLIGLLVAGLLAFGGWLYWQSHVGAQAAGTGKMFSKALEELQGGRPKAAAAALDPIAKGDDPTYRALALMAQGNVAASQGDARTAASRFGTVANDTSVDQALRNVAMIRQTLAEFDTLAPAAVIARLRNLVATDGPAFPSAAELTALAELKRGNDRAAGLLFKRIAESSNSPDSLKSRAVQMAGMLGVDATATTDDAPGDAAATPAGQNRAPAPENNK